MIVKFIITALLLWKAHVSSATHLICPSQNGPGEAILFKYPNDCSKFVTCDSGTEVVRDCAPGTLWNDVVKTCDHPRNVKCGAESTISPTSSTRSYRTRPPIVTTTIAYAINPITLPSMNGGCPSDVDANNPVFMPHLDCARFYVCTLHGPVELSCKEGLHWSIKTNHCEHPREAWCVTSATPPSTSDGCPSVIDPNNAVFLPHPDSTKIYICISGIGRAEWSCPKGHHWSAEGCIPGTDSSTSSSTPGATATNTQPTSTASSLEPTETEEYFTTDSYN